MRLVGLWASIGCIGSASLGFEVRLMDGTCAILGEYSNLLMDWVHRCMTDS